MGSPPLKKLKTHPSAGKIMAIEVLNSEGAIHVDFLSHGVTINAQFCNNVHHVIQKKRHEKLSKIILLHDNACPHTANGLGYHEQS
jgi:hypothetical protein